MLLALLLGPILEELFSLGCLLPLLQQTTSTSLGVILTALFALFHQPTRAAFAIALCVCGPKPYFGIVANRN